jgi:glycosyltransferase involved in cell wall biosynthesis
MKVIVHDYAGHPLHLQLSRALAARGYQVTHLYAGYNLTPRGSLEVGKNDPPGLQIEGVFIDRPLQKGNLIKRFFQENEYGAKLIQAVDAVQPDLVLSANTPLDAQLRLSNYCEKAGIKTIFWMQDILSIGMSTILTKKLPILGSIIGLRYSAIEKRTLKQADHVVVIAEEFRSQLTVWGIENQKITVIPNWGPLEELAVKPKQNSWSKKQALSETFNFLYAGTLGFKHNPARLVELCIAFQDQEAIRIVTVSEGIGAAWLAEQKEKHELSNLVILPFQPYQTFANVLASADVLLILLEKEAGRFSVPSKVYTSLCAERAILASIPHENLAAELLNDHHIGLQVEPDDAEGFVEQAKTLHQSAQLRNQLGENARKFADNNFNINNIADQFIRLIYQITN